MQTFTGWQRGAQPRRARYSLMPAALRTTVIKPTVGVSWQVQSRCTEGTHCDTTLSRRLHRSLYPKSSGSLMRRYVPLLQTPTDTAPVMLPTGAATWQWQFPPTPFAWTYG